MLHVEATVAESERIRAAPPAAPSLDDLLMHAWAATINDTHGAARAQFEAILLQHPTSAGAREGAAWMTAAQVMNEPVADAATQLQYAERLIREAQQMRPNSARVHYIKGFVLRAQGRFEEALAALERSLAINHGYTMAHNMIGEVLLRMGRPEEALVSIETMMRLEPTGPNIGFAMASAGLAHLMLGNYDAGADHLRKAIDLKPNLGWPLALLAAAEVLRGNVEAGQAIALEFRRLPSRLPVDRITGGSQARPSFRERIQPVVEAMRIAGIDDTPAVSAR
jgi:tetratricopeptide (TPR) repeat protein